MEEYEEECERARRKRKVVEEVIISAVSIDSMREDTIKADRNHGTLNHTAG